MLRLRPCDPRSAFLCVGAASLLSCFIFPGFASPRRDFHHFASAVLLPLGCCGPRRAWCCSHVCAAGIRRAPITPLGCACARCLRHLLCRSAASFPAAAGVPYAHAVPLSLREFHAFLTSMAFTAGTFYGGGGFLGCMRLFGVLRLPCVVLLCVVADFGATSLFRSLGLNVVRQLGTTNTSLLHTFSITVAVTLPGPRPTYSRGVAVFHSIHGFRVVPMWFGGVFAPAVCYSPGIRRWCLVVCRSFFRVPAVSIFSYS